MRWCSTLTPTVRRCDCSAIAPASRDRAEPLPKEGEGALPPTAAHHVGDQCVVAQARCVAGGLHGEAGAAGAESVETRIAGVDARDHAHGVGGCGEAHIGGGREDVERGRGIGRQIERTREGAREHDLAGARTGDGEDVAKRDMRRIAGLVDGAAAPLADEKRIIGDVGPGEGDGCGGGARRGRRGWRIRCGLRRWRRGVQAVRGRENRSARGPMFAGAAKVASR